MNETGHVMLTTDAATQVARSVRFAARLSREAVNRAIGNQVPAAYTPETVVAGVVVTGDPPGGTEELSSLWPGTAYYPNPAGSPTWLTADCWVRPITGDTYSIGQRGLGRMTGWRVADEDYDALPIFTIVSGESPLLGCHLAYDDDGKIKVTPSTLAGDAAQTALIEYVPVGPPPPPGSPPLCTQLGVDLAEDSFVTYDRVIAATLAVAPADVPAIVLTQTSREFSFSSNAAGILIGTSEAGGGAETDYTVSFVDSDTIHWFATTVDGTLIAHAVTQMSVTSDANGLKLVNDQLAPGNWYTYSTDGAGVKGWINWLAVTSTLTIDVVTDVTQSIVAGNLRLAKTKRPINFDFNDAGEVIGVSFGMESVTNSDVDTCLFAACCGATTLTVVAAADPTSAAPEDDVDFTATPGGGVPPYTYLWDFGDGETSTDQNPTHAYAEEGEYEALVTVTDACGRVSTDSVVVTVGASPPPTDDHYCISGFGGPSGAYTVPRTTGGVDSWSSGPGVTLEGPGILGAGNWELTDTTHCPGDTWTASGWDGTGSTTFSSGTCSPATLTVTAGTC